MVKAIAALLVLCASASVQAQESAAPAPVSEDELDPAAVDAARDLLVAGDFDEQLERTAQLGSQVAFGTVLRHHEERLGFDFPEDLEAQLRQILMDHMDAYIATFRRSALEQSARVYARYFSAEEIRELQRLQSHPVMIKFQRVAPQFMVELGQIGLGDALQTSPALEQRIGEAVTTWMVRNARHGEAPGT